VPLRCIRVSVHRPGKVDLNLCVFLARSKTTSVDGTINISLVSVQRTSMSLRKMRVFKGGAIK